MRALGIFFVVIICVAIIAFAFAVPTLERKAREQIIEQLKTKLDAKVELKSVRLSSLWPLGLKLQDLKIVPQNGQYRVDVEKMYLRYHYFFTSRAEIDIEKPNIEWLGITGSTKEKKAPPVETVVPSTPSPAMSAFMAGLGLQFYVREGIVRWQKDDNTQLRLQKLNVDILKAKVLSEDEPIKALIDAELHYTTPLISGQTNVSAKTSDLKVNLDQASSQESEFQIGGIVVRASGASDLKLATHDWKIRINVEDLQKLPRPPDFLPAQNWKGKINFETTVHADKKDVKAQGLIKLEKVSMDLRWDSPDLKAQGPVNIDVNAAFEWANQQYSVKDVTLWAELTRANLQYSNLFKKPADVPLNFDFKGAMASNAVDIHSLTAKLFNLTAQAKGSVPFKGTGKIVWQTEPTNLVGWEKLILPMNQTPLQGMLEVRGDVSGSFAAPQEMAINVSRLSLKDFKGQLKYKSNDEKLIVEGPVTANVDGKLALKGEKVHAADMTARADLTSLIIRKIGVFEKKAGDTFQVNVTAKQQQDDIGIEKSEFKLPFMTVNVGGRIHNPKDPSFKLNIRSDVSNLDLLKAYVPSLKELPMNGSIKAQIGLDGKYATEKPWTNWPMKVSGNVSWSTPLLTMPSGPAAKTGKPPVTGSPPAATVTPGPFLQKGYLTENLNVGLDANITKFVKDKLVMEGTTVKGRITNGQYRGNLSSRGFGGLVQLNNMLVPLFEADPVVVSDVRFSDIKIESILEFLKPEFKDAAKGPSRGDVHVESLLPSSPRFMPKLKARGSVGSDNIWINTVSLNQMINDKISKVPGVPKNAVKLDPLQGRLDSHFNLENEKADPLSVDGFDRGGSELHLKGSANLEQTVDLTGEFRWANPPISGCLKEGNADDKGRIVVPLVLKGPVTSPSWSFATDVIAKMGEKALRCEAVKALQKQIPINLPGNVGDEIGKKLKDLLGH